jgi:hypothetical protein
MRQTCRGDTRLLVSLDYDDPAYGDYPAGPMRQTLSGVRGVVGHFNAAAEGFGRDFKFIGALGDDFLPGTDAWDAEIMEALNDTPFAYGNECFPGRVPGESVCHIFMRSSVAKALGYVAVPTMKHMYCVAPDTPVLTADLHWIPAGKVTVGDELMGVDEFSPRPRMTRHFRRATVTAARRRISECVRVDLEDGRQVTCSAEHRWLAKQRWQGKGQRSPGKFEWRESAHLRHGDQIVSPLRVWADETSFEIGWLSGIFDGEGSASRRRISQHKPYFNTSVSVAQNPGAVLERIESTLGAMGINYRVAARRTYKGRAGVVVLEITPRSHCVELLGRLQPSRLCAESIWEDMPMQPRDSSAHLAEVVGVSLVGIAEVASLQTSTGTFLANGLVAHNCDNAWAAWGKACGITYLDGTVIEHLHFTVGKSARDATYDQAMSFGDADRAAWDAYLAGGLADDVAKIRAVT